MSNALFLFRFHCKEPASDYAGLPTFHYRPGIFVHTLERVKAFTEETGVPIHFVCIADNSTPALVNRCEEKMYSILPNTSSIIRTNCIEDIFNAKFPNHAERQLEDGTITNKWMHTTFTFYVTSMKEIKKRADENTIVFFCESDYLYSEDALTKGFYMAREFTNDFVTLYEHPGSYTVTIEQIQTLYPNFMPETITKYNHNWRRVTSTCLTFIGSMVAINKYPNLFLDCEADWGDSALWSNIMNDGDSKLWMSVPSLVYHTFSHNMTCDNWINLEQSMLEKGV
jgi:hypothetical protein